MPVTYGDGAVYSSAADRIAFSRYDPDIKGPPTTDNKKDKSGTFELWTADPDGSEERCISCRDITGGPSRHQHKGTPTWHPSGKWLVVSVEMKAPPMPHRYTVPGRGLFTDLWAVSADGKKWCQLTHYANQLAGEHFPNAPGGAMMPHFTHAGGKLVWEERIGGSKKHPYGIWQIAIADFTFGPDGAELRNKQVYSPGEEDAAFFDGWSLSPDDSEMLLNSDSDVDNPAFMRVERWNLRSKELSNLTESENQFEEHGIFSPEGDLIAFSSTDGVVPPFEPKTSNFMETFRSDVWIMKSDGSGTPTRVTYFNLPGHPHYLPGQYRVIPLDWVDERTLLLELDPVGVQGEYDIKGSRIYWLDLP